MISGDEGGDAFMATSAPGLTDESAPPLESGTRLGPWKILEPIDTGGMGAVYRAERADGLYDQTVAIKLIRGLDAQQVSRFEGERQRLAQMDHPGIAPIIDGGTAPDGRPFMVMSLVDGQPMDEALDRQGASTRDRVQCLVRLCDAVAHAHGRLILHQDIKPANVLVDEAGQPRLIDFGISYDLREQDPAGSGGLTVRYAAPELLRGESGSVQTDIFSLGILLYVTLSGLQPSRTTDGGIDLSVGQPIDKDLWSVIARATAAAPELRYGAAELLAADLEAWLDKRPVEARNGGRIYRIGKFLRRYPVASASAVVAVLALAAGLGASLKFGADAQREAERANAALVRAEYQFQKADAFLKAQDVLNDLLLAAYGGESEGAESLTEKLMGRWREAHEASLAAGEDVDGAATMAFALGRNLYLRRDLVPAIEVFSAWLDADYGSTILRDAGEHLYALSLYDGGYGQRALPLLRSSLAAEIRNRSGAADRFNLAIRIARWTSEEDDIRVAREIFQDFREESESDDLTINQRIEQHATAYQIHTLAEDYRSAASELGLIVELCNEYPDAAPAMRGTARSLLALTLIYALEEYETAEQVARLLVTEDVERVGENVNTGHGYMLLAEALRERGAYDAAIDALDRARELNIRYANGGEGGTVAENLIRVRVLVERGQVEPAKALAARVYDAWRSANPEPAVPPADLRLTLLWIETLDVDAPPQDFAARLADAVQPGELRPIGTRWLYQRIAVADNQRHANVAQ